MKKKISLGVIVLLILIQFIPVKKNQNDTEVGYDILSYNNISETAPVAVILKTSCYDCHSNTTAYPWYNSIAPVSWYLARHINEGKKHLNFSEWKYMEEAKREHKLEECVEMLKENEMPLTSYTLVHTDAELSKEEKERLIGFFNGL